MPNMSYCIFENTSHDLQQAAEKMDELILDDIEVSDLSPSERRGLKRLLETVQIIHEDFAPDLWVQISKLED